MDLKSIKLVYSKKYNQFYKIIRIDEDVGIIYIIPTKNRHDKTIRKNEILCIEDNLNYQYVVMHDKEITAEQHFIDVFNDEICSVHIKLNEIRDFKKNMLPDSENAVSIIKRNAGIKGYKGLTDNERKIRNASLMCYRGLDVWKKEQVKNNRASYENQVIPNNIIQLALSKRLFIERRDEYCFKTSNTYEKKLAPKQARHSIQSNFPCGFLIKNKGGYIVAGKQGKNYYTLSVDEVIDFVKEYKYDPSKTYKKMYRVPTSERKERELSMCNKILLENDLRLKNEHNYFFWVLDKKGNVIAGGKNGFGFKWLLKYCRRLRSQSKK